MFFRNSVVQYQYSASDMSTVQMKSEVVKKGDIKTERFLPFNIQSEIQVQYLFLETICHNESLYLF